MKDPFRTAAVVEPPRTPKPPSRVKHWLDRNWPPLLLGSIIVACFGDLFWWAASDEHRLATAPCESFASTAMKDIPARCVGYWSKRQAGE
jgi:hypothetical protein